MGDPGRYLYAVGRGLDPDGLTDVTGLTGGSIDVLEHRGLQAVVSTVDLDEYGEEALRANLERLDWLEVAARTHDAVVQAAGTRATVAPMRLATIFIDDDSLRRQLDQWRDLLDEVLDRIEGRREWSVKVISPKRSAQGPPAETPATSGADYLRRKKVEAHQRDTWESAARHAAETIHDTLSRQSVASRTLPPQDPRLTGLEGTMVLNAAYLVDSAGGSGFLEAVDACASLQEQLNVEVRGPWPPYSFATLEQP